MQYRLLRALMMLFPTHVPSFSQGITPLKNAIESNRPDVIAFLRSVGAPECGHVETYARGLGEYRPCPCIVDAKTLLIFSCIVPLMFAPDLLFL